jgi:hypothetical protein
MQLVFLYGATYVLEILLVFEIKIWLTTFKMCSTSKWNLIIFASKYPSSYRLS